MTKFTFADIVTVAPKAKHTATVIFLHGLGDSGDGWGQYMYQLQRAGLQHVKFVCPSAGDRPITINMGMTMPGWYDIASLDKSGSEDVEGLTATANEIAALIQQEMDEHKIPSSRIVLAGFSQGGCVSLTTGMFVTKHKLAGIASLSGYVGLRDRLSKSEAEGGLTDVNLRTPLQMYHGTHDQVVNFKWGQFSFEAILAARKERLAKAGDSTQASTFTNFKSYPGMEHSSCDTEMRDFVAFLNSTIPEKFEYFLYK